MNSDEEAVTRALLALLDEARQYEALTGAETGQHWRARPGSALEVDDNRTHPYQVSHSAWHALTVAVDHLHCLRSSLLTRPLMKRRC